MRLWHYKLIPLLPKSQLLAQWRELNSIFKKQDKHILINYIYEYPKKDLILYTDIVIGEMKKRGYQIRSFANFDAFVGSKDYIGYEFFEDYKLFERHHTYRYMQQCFFNLQEKFDRGQKDFSKAQYEELYKFLWRNYEA